jgi:hypothetical protein
MNDQANKELEMLRHVVFNGIGDIMGCFKIIERRMELMTEAVKTYKADFEGEFKNDVETKAK